ncbi:HelicaseC-terminal [Penicillium lividum]|nr:HelicaseC-terminal [Penicillium lividum]
MQSWTGGGSRSLFCAFRSLSIHNERHFTTTSLLQRMSKAVLKAKLKQQATALEASKGGRKGKNSKDAQKSLARARDFNSVIETALRDTKQRLRSTAQSLDGWERLERQVLNACRVDEKRGPSVKWTPLRELKGLLQKAYLSKGVQGVRDELEYMLFAEDLTNKYSTSNLEAQRKVVDLRFPAEWYPSARSIQRKIHLHVGPTNSGKTYHALKRLEQAKAGFYAGPLRLLAQEVYHRFKDNGIPCSLVTGDEVQTPEDGKSPRVVSNTVEMVSLGQAFDVGVIDEIQMIADPNRGWAWTRAVLGCQASELHLCGETRTVPLIRELCALTGDILEIHRYQRLNGLEVMPHSLRGNLKLLQKGDCLVAFSRVGIHALKADIEKITGKRAAIVYGGLPAPIRTQQAALFNDPDNDYDYLVASDAIGMGLNLACKRVIFETLIKRTPAGLVQLTVPEIKQIGGRAGRYRPAGATDSSQDGANIGLVTCLEDVDLPYIEEAMQTEPPPLTAAGLMPPGFVVEKFSSYFPRNVPFEYLIKRMLDIAQMNRLFFMCNSTSQIEACQVVDAVEGLGLLDKLFLTAAPLETRNQALRDVTLQFAECIASNSQGRLLDIPYLNLEILERPVSGNKDYMSELEGLHKAIILYSWLSFRFGGVFTDRSLAAHIKTLTEERLMRALTEFSANKRLRNNASLRRQVELQKQIMSQKSLIDDEDLVSSDEKVHELSDGFSDEDSDPVEPIGVLEDTEDFEEEQSPRV